MSSQAFVLLGFVVASLMHEYVTHSRRKHPMMLNDKDQLRGHNLCRKLYHSLTGPLSAVGFSRL